VTIPLRLPVLFAAVLLCRSTTAQTPQKIAFACGAAEIEDFGLTCSADEPCDVFLELTSIESLGTRLFITGNFHTESATLGSVLLVSEDAGATWTEGFPRQKGALLDQIQFADLQAGWISGHTLYPLPRDPFLLVTTDGGKTWKKQLILEEGSPGSIEQFRFDSRSHGLMVLSLGRGGKWELWETNTGADSWDVKERSARKITIPQTPREAQTWRLRGDQKSKTLRVEQRGTNNWTAVAVFELKAGVCKPE
jgi:photosystem II stability/assembly factor-like uncharacterized protein